MTFLTLEIENEQDTRLFTELAERLHIKIKQQVSLTDSDVVSETEQQNRMSILSEFRGKLKDYKAYKPSKSEFYEQ
jgi:hypothetical protein